MSALRRLRKALPGPVRRLGQRPFIAWIDRRLERDAMRMLFIVGHMRSGSTLLLHLLASHEEIGGYGEAHFTYRSADDFGESAYRITRAMGRFVPPWRYVVDKVLHDDYGLEPGLLRTGGTRSVLLARSPEGALPSMLAVGFRQVATEETALDYYVRRMRSLRELAAALGPERACLVTYDGLLDDTEAAFRRLERFLGLGSPLSERYETMWSTGESYVGDPSERIRRGRIVRSASPHDVEVSDGAMEAARREYDRTLDEARASLERGRAVR